MLDTVGPRRKANDRTDGTQPGDIRRAPRELIIETVAKPKLPKRLLLGSDAVTIVRKGLEAQLEEIRRGAGRERSHRFPEGATKLSASRQYCASTDQQKD